MSKVSTLNDANLIYPNLPFAATEAYKMLRTNIVYSFTDEISCPVIGITSSLKGEGKSTTAINIAYTLAVTNKKVLFIECDMRLPSTGKHLHIQSEDGLSSILTGVQKNIASVIIKDKSFPNLNFMLSGPIPPNPSEILDSNSMKKVLELLKKEYDYIVLDLPPITLVSDPIVVSKYTDGMIIVTRQDYSEKKALHQSISQLKYVNARILGFVYRGQKNSGFGYGNKYSGKYEYK